MPWPLLRTTAVLGLLLALAPLARADGPLPYDFELRIASRRLVGSYPVNVAGVRGTADLRTDVKGRLAGTLSIGGVEYAATGKVKSTPKIARIVLKGRADEASLLLEGTLEGGAFSGSSRGRGGAAGLTGEFTLDVSSATPLDVAFDFEIEAGARGRLTGTGVADATGEPIALKASGRIGRRLKLKLAGRGLRWTGKGDAVAGGFSVTWKAKGYGAKANGEGFDLPILSPPIDLAYAESPLTCQEKVPVRPSVPVVAGGPVDGFSVEPPLPAGLSLDEGTGAISGTPEGPFVAATHVVTAENAAGATSVRLKISARADRETSLAPLAGPHSDDDVRHLLVRTRWGASPAEFAAAKKQGVPAYVKAILSFPGTSAVEKEADALLVNDDDPKGPKGGFPSATQLARWWLDIMTRTKHPFQEVLAFFWHDHFATSSDVLSADRRYWMKSHVNLWRTKGNGNLRDLLVEMARDWAMLTWLNGETSTKRAPNENFAREFWELFTLGVDNGYTQEDILESARAFTGYRSRLNEETEQRYIEFDPDRHDAGDKTFFGRTIPGQNTGDDYEAVVDITLEERPVAEFICRKLFEHFCYQDPPQEVVDELAALLRDSDWELKPVLRTLLGSEAFFSARSREGFVKSPVEFAVGFIRSSGLRIRLSRLDTSVSDQGQRPTQPPTVNGWPIGAMWLSAQAMVERANLVNECVTDTTRQAEAGIRAADLLPEGARDAGAVVDAIADVLRVTLSEEDRADCVEYLETQRTSDGQTAPSPYDPDDPELVESRVRGLLYVLAQHPTYQRR